MVVAYLRVSTEKQFLANQREELLRFAEKNGLQIDKWYTETVSGSVRSKDRKLSGVLNRMQRGDSLIVTEISRLSRTMLEIMTILNSCIKKEIVLYSTKEGSLVSGKLLLRIRKYLINNIFRGQTPVHDLKCLHLQSVS